jgi:glycine oxidase
MPDNPDVLIIGGGVIGLTTAYFLARDGASVTVVDKGDFGQEASWAGAGILPPCKPSPDRHPYDQLRGHSMALYPTLSAELRQKTGIDNGFLQTGGLVLAVDEAAFRQWQAEGVSCEMVEGKSLYRIEPELTPDVKRACYLPEVCQLRNPRHLKALLAGCQSLGVKLRPGCACHGFARQGNRINSLWTAAGSLVAGRYLVAAGAWTDSLLGPLGWRPGVHPIRGQIVLLNTGPGVMHRIIEQAKRYIVPRPDGRVLIGSTEEAAGYDKRTTALAIGELLAFGLTLVPALASAQLERCWAGLRPGTADGMPFIGPVPGLENLFVSAGHFRSGLTLAPATALVMKELLLGQPLTVPLEGFRLDRVASPGESEA